MENKKCKKVKKLKKYKNKEIEIKEDIKIKK